jgi:hypothetical protein
MVGTLIRRPLPPVSDFIRTLLDDPDATTALATLGVVSGTYTPTLFNTTNMAASTAYITLYLRVNDRVIVSGRADVDPTANATPTTLGVSLPVASNLASSLDLMGVATSGQITETCFIDGDTANDRGQISFVSTSLSVHVLGFIFMYRVL